MPRAGVTPEKIFDAAEELVNERGYGALALGTIARRLGIRTPSLYKHVDGLAEIEEGLALRGYEGLRAALRRCDHADPRNRLRAAAREYRRFARANPGLYGAIQISHVHRTAPVRCAAEEVLSLFFDLLRTLGVAECELVSAARSYRSALHGFVDLELAGGFGLPEDLDASFEYLVERWLAGGA
jgi:AcrR family transcriptional regulator